MTIPKGNIKNFRIICVECKNQSIDRCEYCGKWYCDLHFYGNKECGRCHFRYKNVDRKTLGFGAKP